VEDTNNDERRFRYAKVDHLVLVDMREQAQRDTLAAWSKLKVVTQWGDLSFTQSRRIA
jgi:hypothetical protein